MRLSFFVPAIAGLLLLSAGPSAQAAPKGKIKPGPRPTLVLRLASLDALIKTGKELAKLADQEELFEQVEGFLKDQTGPKGLEGVDTKKPIGAYAFLEAKLPRSHVAVMLPVADEKTFLKFLKGLDFEPEKDKTGLYKLVIEGLPLPILFRFGNGYLYVTAQVPGGVGLPKDKLPLPSDILPKTGPLLSLTAHLDSIPASVRKVALTGVATRLGQLKDEDREGENAGQKALRLAVLDELGDLAKMLINQGRSLALKLDHDSKNKELSLAVDLSGKKGTELARNIIGMGKLQSVAAALAGADSVMGGHFTFVLPKRLNKALTALVGEAEKKVEKEEDKDRKDAGTAVVAAVKSALKDGQIDLGFDLRGPGKSGKYTLVLGGRLADGAAVEKAIRKVVAVLPEAATQAIKLDAAKAGKAKVHTLTPDNVDENTKKLLGEGPIHVAFRKDAVLATMGDAALGVLEKALAVKAKTAQPLRLEVSVSRLAALIPVKKSLELAKKAFKEKGSDRATLSLSAGSALELRLKVKTQVLAFGGQLDKAQKKEKEDKGE